jgi:hypothetical protein
MNEDSFDRLHVLIADENEQRLDQIATVVSDLGHSVVSRLTEVSQVAAEPSVSALTLPWWVSDWSGRTPWI